jgi:micrococcal nuclease
MPVFVLLLLLSLSAALPAQELTGTVVAVHDGDTLSVRIGTEVVRVRLAGIDCPEQEQAWGARARERTTELTMGRTVRVTRLGIDKFDRWLVRLASGGTDVNLALVRAGLAWHYEPNGGAIELTEAERGARNARRGLWSDAHPEPPWQWRREHPRDGAITSRPTPNARSSRANAIADDNPAGPLHGNVRSRRFHRPGCPNYNCKHCTESFLTEDSARDAGYSPAGDCRR